ncbi:MAG: hypothetical protein GY702_24055 [Desulfobulbaceae bacterium]|nr:hypothetical protein [Desulfobulbaceae bacterium]
MPLFSGFWTYVFLKEHITVLHLTSALLIASGIAIANHKRKK